MENAIERGIILSGGRPIRFDRILAPFPSAVSKDMGTKE
jgi:hypothetical protein